MTTPNIGPHGVNLSKPRGVKRHKIVGLAAVREAELAKAASRSSKLMGVPVRGR